MQMLDLPVRHEQTVLIVEVSMPVSHAIEVTLNRRAVVGMDTLHDEIERRLDRSLKPDDLVSLFGPVHFFGGDLPPEASSQSELLRLGQVGFAALQCVLGPLSILDIGVRPIPSDDISG